VLKKKKTTSYEVDDLFASDGGDELFGSKKVPSSKASRAIPTNLKKQVALARVSTRKRLSSEDRILRFDELRTFVADRIGLKPAATTPEQVRNSAWHHLFGLATTREQLESVTELFSKWRDSRRSFGEETVKVFVRRCEELHCSDLALQVFSNHSKYGFPLNSISAARQLMHSLHVEHPLSASMTLVALYKIYNLPPVSTDLVSTAMLASACFKTNSKQSNIVANALVPSLRNMIVESPPIPLPPKGSERAMKKETAWLARTLFKVEKALEKQNAEYQWLRDWRIQSGHLSIVA